MLANLLVAAACSFDEDRDFRGVELVPSLLALDLSSLRVERFRVLISSRSFARLDL
jgi:hypothetical protein